MIKMDYQHACVVDAEKNYKTLVLVLLEQDEDGQPKENLQYYELLEGESLVDTAPPSMRSHAGADGLIRPRWDDHAETWVEGAAAEEIATWEAAHPAPAPPGPTPQEDADAMIVDHEYRLTLLELGV